MRSIVINIRISAEEYLKNYQHPGAVVVTHSEDGQRVKFPANIMQRFVTRSGVAGRFRIQFDDGGKFQGLQRL